jgi:hypothetical protein
MNPALPNFIFGAIYRTRTGEPDASATAAAYCCYAPGLSRQPGARLLRRLLGCDEFGRIDPGLNVSPIPVRHEDPALSSMLSSVTRHSR